MVALYRLAAIYKVEERANLTPLPLAYLKPASISLKYSNSLLADLAVCSCLPSIQSTQLPEGLNANI